MLQKWYPGHMAKAIKQLQADISRSQIGAIIEVRDSRVPLSCTNWQFENLLLGESAGRGKLTLEFKDPWGKKYGSSVNKPHRVILCNKYDRVGEANAHSKIPEWRYNLTENFSNFTKVPVFFGSKADKDSLNKLMMHLVQNWIELHSSKMARFPNCVYPPLNIAVIGLPNTGKSSIINSLRVIGSGISGKNGAKVAKVGKNPGYTKSISSKIKIIDSETPINLGENDKRHYLEITKMLFSKGIRLQVFVIDSRKLLRIYVLKIN